MGGGGISLTSASSKSAPCLLSKYYIPDEHHSWKLAQLSQYVVTLTHS